MAYSLARRASALGRSRALAFAFGVAIFGLPAKAPAADTINVVIDQDKLVGLPDRIATIVIGNPLIAGVTLVPGGVVITGKGYGKTNLIALDRAGAVLMETSVEVRGPGADVVVVYRGVERETYSCTPYCERRITLGDSPAYFDAVIGQTGTRNGQAQGGGSGPK